MKKLLFYILITCVLVSIRTALHAQAIEKQTYVFAVKGNDTLKVDKYSAIDSLTDSVRKPVVLFAFGGGFKGGERDNPVFIPFFQTLVQNGYTVVSTDYRTGLKGIDGSKMATLADFSSALQQAITMAVEDFLDATGFIIRNSDDWRINPAQIIACGSSAGAVTVLQAEYELCNHELLKGFNYAGIVSFAGAICSKGAPQWKNKPCPMMLFHGNADRIVPFNKAMLGDMGLWGSNVICAELKEKEVPHYFYMVEGADHEMSNVPMRHNHYDVLSFLDRLVMRKQKACITVVENNPGRAPYKTDYTTEDYIRENLR
jgi:dipeptidyl aminopeptidase/acylaminoacyl peptidase